MRTAIRVIKNTALIPYNDNESQKEILMGMLLEEYKNKIIYSGMVSEILSLELSEYASPELTTDGLLFQIPYIATLKILYYKIGDVLFDVEFKDKIDNFPELFGIKYIINVKSPFQIIVKTGKHNVLRGNIIIIDIINSSTPSYKAELAIYPLYTPIVSQNKYNEIEKSIYEDVKPSKITKNMDPLYGDKDRFEKMITEISEYANLKNYVIAGKTEYIKEIKYKPIQNIDKPLVEFVQLDSIKEIVKMRKNPKLLYHPMMELFKEYAVIISNSDSDIELNDKIIDCFIFKVREYLMMKKMETKYPMSI